MGEYRSVHGLGGHHRRGNSYHGGVEGEERMRGRGVNNSEEDQYKTGEPVAALRFERGARSEARDGENITGDGDDTMNAGSGIEEEGTTEQVV